MRKINGQCIYSPSDLIRFMESEYASWMDRLHLEIPDSVQPDPDSAADEILRAKGEEHELAFLEQLIADGRDVVNLKGSFGNIAETLLAMKRGTRNHLSRYSHIGCACGYCRFSCARQRGLATW